MTPAAAIAMLDRQLAQHGQDVKLRHTTAAAGEVTARAVVRGIRADEFASWMQQGDRKVVVSPTSLAAFGEPKDGEFVVFDGKPRRIVGEPELIRVAGTLVRVNMIVRG